MIRRLCMVIKGCNTMISNFYQNRRNQGYLGGTGSPIFETCKKRTFKNNEKSYKLQYFHLVKILKEEFHGLYKACDIKSELNYNGDLEGRQPLNIKTIFLT